MSGARPYLCEQELLPPPHPARHRRAGRYHDGRRCRHQRRGLSTDLKPHPHRQRDSLRPARAHDPGTHRLALRLIDGGSVALRATLDLVDANNCTITGNQPIKQVEVSPAPMASSSSGPWGPPRPTLLQPGPGPCRRVSTTTAFAYTVEGGPLSPVTVVHVDRTRGTCAGTVTLTAPEQAAAGTTYSVRGQAPAGQRGELILTRDGFDQPRAVPFTVGADAQFAVGLRATVIETFYATVAGCASTAASTYPAPTISGPASVRRDDTALLTVRAFPNEYIEVWFRRAGTSTFVKARSERVAADGIYTTGFVVSADHRYYAKILGGIASASRVTQAR